MNTCCSGATDDGLKDELRKQYTRSNLRERPSAIQFLEQSMMAMQQQNISDLDGVNIETQEPAQFQRLKFNSSERQLDYTAPARFRTNSLSQKNDLKGLNIEQKNQSSSKRLMTPPLSPVSSSKRSDFSQQKHSSTGKRYMFRRNNTMTSERLSMALNTGKGGTNQELKTNILPQTNDDFLDL